MIGFVTPEREALFVEEVLRFGIFGTKIYSQYRTYGAQSDAAQFWLLFWQERVCGAISRLDGRFTIAASGICEAQADELAAFLRAAGGNALEGELAVLARLRGIADGAPLASSCIWRWAGQEPCAAALPDGAVVAHAESLREVFLLLCACDEAFAAETCYDAWLCDLSHKTRHDLAEVFTLSVDNIIISTQSILFMGETTAILAAVATAPDMRRRGYAGALLDRVTAAALARERTPQLLAASDALGPFYARHGFVPVGRWARLSLTAEVSAK